MLLRCFGHLGGKCHLDIWLCLKDHFDKSLVCFSEGHVGPDEGFGDVWLRPERSEGLHFFNAALDRGYAQFGF